MFVRPAAKIVVNDLDVGKSALLPRNIDQIILASLAFQVGHDLGLRRLAHIHRLTGEDGRRKEISIGHPPRRRPQRHRPRSAYALESLGRRGLRTSLTYQGGFATLLILKDLEIAAGAAADPGADTPMGAKAAELYQRFTDEGHGGLDFSGIIKMLRG